MKNIENRSSNVAERRLHETYREQKPKLMSRLRKAGKTLEEAEDLIHDLYLETMEKLPLMDTIRSLPAWINSLFRRRMIDQWRREKTRESKGETDVAEDTLRDIMVATGLDPLDEYVRSELTEALNDAMAVLPVPQRKIIEAQVFGGWTFREIAEKTGESIDTLTARKRYAVKTLAKALRHWIDDE